MEQSEDTAVVRVATTQRFEENDVTVITVEGNPAVLCMQVACAWGYERGDAASKAVLRSEGAELGVDYARLTGAELRPLKDAGLVGKRARAVLVLFESGVHLLALRSKQPAAKRLRRWLAREVLPAIRAKGEYIPKSAAAQPAAIEQRPAPVEGASAAMAKIYAAVVFELVHRSGIDSLAVHEMLRGTGHGGSRYYRSGGTTEAQLQRDLVRDVKALPAQLRDQLARWLSVHLGVRR